MRDLLFNLCPITTYLHFLIRFHLCLSLCLHFSSHLIAYRTSPDGVEVLTMPNGLYQLARRLCIVLNQPKLTDVLLSNAVRYTDIAV